MSSKAGNKKIKLIQNECQIVENLLLEEDNKYCVDCNAKGPRWASWNLGIFLCTRCAGIHRKLDINISKVKRVNSDTWTAEQVACLQQMGNSQARAVYEANLPGRFKRPQTDSSLEMFIRAKYEGKKYIDKEWVPPPAPKPAFDMEEGKRKAREIKNKAATATEVGAANFSPELKERAAKTAAKLAIVCKRRQKKTQQKSRPEKAATEKDQQTISQTKQKISKGNQTINCDWPVIDLTGLSSDDSDSTDLTESERILLITIIDDTDSDEEEFTGFVEGGDFLDPHHNSSSSSGVDINGTGSGHMLSDDDSMDDKNSDSYQKILDIIEEESSDSDFHGFTPEDIQESESHLENSKREFAEFVTRNIQYFKDISELDPKLPQMNVISSAESNLLTMQPTTSMPLTAFLPNDGAAIHPVVVKEPVKLPNIWKCATNAQGNVYYYLSGTRYRYF